MTAMTATPTAAATSAAGRRVNGIDVDQLAETVKLVEREPSQAQVGFRVRSRWAGQCRSEAAVEAYMLGGQRIERSFRLAVDEPTELGGENTAANPQEVLMAAVNACMMVGYVAGAAMRGIELDAVEIETDGNLDLRGFLGVDPSVKPGYETLRYVVRISGSGTPEQFREIHETVMKTSPNYFNMASPIRMDGRLEVA